MIAHRPQVVLVFVKEVAVVRDLKTVVREVAAHLVTRTTADLAGTTTSILTNAVIEMIEMIDVPSEAHLKTHTPVDASHATAHEVLLRPAAIEIAVAPALAMAETAIVITHVAVVTGPVLAVRIISTATSQGPEEKVLIPEIAMGLETVVIEEAGTEAAAHIEIGISTTGPLVSPNPIVTCLA